MLTPTTDTREMKAETSDFAEAMSDRPKHENTETLEREKVGKRVTEAAYNKSSAQPIFDFFAAL